MATYYSSKPTLAESTALYTDTLLTIPADNGYYSADGVSRQQTSGVLQTQATCAPCVDLPNTVLTLVDYNVGSSISNFKYTLTNSLPFDITISLSGVNIYSDLNLCNIDSLSYDYQDTFPSTTIIANATSIIGNGNTPPPCATVFGYYYRPINNISLIIGGNTYSNLYNGYKVTVGGHDIFIQIYPSCFFITTECV
jgi:hypothetical protein